MDIQVDGTSDGIDAFIISLKSDLPPLARIDSIDVSRGPLHGFNGFEIIISRLFRRVPADLTGCIYLS